MSAQLMARVYEYQLTHGEQSVLLAMADHADDDGNNVYPSVAYLSWKTDYSERQIQRIMHGLTKRRILIVVAPARQHRAAEYRIELRYAERKQPFRPDTMSPLPETRDDTTSPLNGSGVTFETPGVTSATSRGDIAMSPEPSVRTISNEPSVRESAYANGTNGHHARAPTKRPLIPIPSEWTITTEDEEWLRDHGMNLKWAVDRTELFVTHYESIEDTQQVRNSQEGWRSAWQKWLLKDQQQEQRIPSRR